MSHARQLFVTSVLCAALSSAFAQAAPDAAAVDAARAAARADRNAESADLFRQAIAQSPARRRELLPEYADQLLYSHRADEAIPLYREVLAAPRSDDERRGALKGLGLAYLWTDRPSRARPLFEQLARERPGDEDVSRNLGRALSWSGRQREAAAHLQQHLAQHPGDEEARVQLAQAQAWMGRTDKALATLDGMQREDARRLREQLLRDAAPRTSAGYEHSTQSDDLDIHTGHAAQSFGFAQGRGTAGLRLDRVDYERSDGSDGTTVTRPGVFGRFRFSDAFELNGEVGRERIAPRGAAASEFTAYSTWLTFWPNDLLRFDASTSRGDFDNLKSLDLSITHRDTGLSLDVTPTERQRYTARVQHMDISDGNRRDMAQLEGEYRWHTHPDVWAGLRYTHFDFARQLDNGYFNPLHFDSVMGTLRALWRPNPDDGRWEVEARAAWGREHAIPDGDKPAYDVSLRAAYRPDPATRLELRAQRFSSRTSSSTGFARSIFGVWLERSW